jgi:hypothetical protein
VPTLVTAQQNSNHYNRFKGLDIQYKDCCSGPSAWGIPPNGCLDFEIEVSLPCPMPQARCAALLCCGMPCHPARYYRCENRGDYGPPGALL